MFYAIAKLSWAVLAPSNALLILGVLGLVLGRFAKWKRLGGPLTAVAILGLIVASLPASADFLLAPLETRFPPFQPDGKPVAGIVLLGGAIDVRDAPPGFRNQLSDAADRIFEAARLARLFPQARVVITSGSPMEGPDRSEADQMADDLVELGVAPARIQREQASRDTFENATLSRALAKPAAGERWLLVTSAFHMPRAVGCFRKAGFPVTAAPSDWRRIGSWDFDPKTFSPTSGSEGLSLVDLAAREYLGLLAYRLKGRIGSLLPAP
ncbi:MAG: YdcF family protein [Caulobacteraceae bacterium]